MDSIKLTAEKNLLVSVFSKLWAGVNTSGILSESGSCMKQTAELSIVSFEVISIVARYEIS